MHFTILSIILIVIALLIDFFAKKKNKYIKYIILFLGILGCFIVLREGYQNEIKNIQTTLKQNITESELDIAQNRLEKTEKILDESKSNIQSTKEQLEDTQNELDTVKRYEHISKLNFKGSQQDFFYASDPNKPIIPEGLPQTLFGTYVQTNSNGVQYKCDPSALEKYTEAIKFNPDFPFSYFALALCNKLNNQNWIDYAKKSNYILNITTQINGHHKDHDTALNELKELYK